MNTIDALRLCVHAMKQIDFKNCANDEKVWHALNLAQAEAERVLRDGEKQEPTTWLRFRAAQSWSGNGNHDIDYNEWLEECKEGEIGDDKKPAFPVYTHPAPYLPAVGAVTEGVMRALNHARAMAMKNTVEARIPECGDFGAIAQSLDWAINQIPTPQPAAAPSGDAELLDWTKSKSFIHVGRSSGRFECVWLDDILDRRISYGNTIREALRAAITATKE